jgi:hypothetical protein
MTLGDVAAAVAKIKPEYLKEEPRLAEVKWFDYRYLTAVEATTLFAREYVDAYRKSWLHWVPKGSASHYAPVREPLFVKEKSRKLNALWRARQVADESGVPYDFYISRAFEFWIGKAAKRPPAPNQLIGAWEHVANCWEARKKDRGLMATLVTDMRFLNENYRAEPPQDAHHERIIESLRQHHSLSLNDRLGFHIHCHGWLTEARARREFGDPVVDAVKPSGSAFYRPDQGELTSYRPSCLGIPHALNAADNPVCAKCKFQAQCDAEATDALELVIATHGTDDPRLEHRREKDRVRQREWRAANKVKRERKPNAGDPT